MATILAGKGSPVEATFQSSPSWQQAMKRAIRSGRKLCEVLQLVDSDIAAVAAETDFPVFVPLEFVERMQIGNPRDPLLLQVLATHEELSSAPATQPDTTSTLKLSSQGDPNLAESLHSAMLDPVGDLQAQRTAGLLQKYSSRVLMIATGACAIHCRYCFRRHFPYGDVEPGKVGWARSLEIIRRDHTIEEVILSGGDPLTIADEQLAWLIEELDTIPHLQRIRLHTRVPVVIPQRICEPLLDWVRSSRKAIFFVFHFNHPAEIDQHVVQQMKQLRRTGVTLLNQAVLLRGINDSANVQRDLCLALVNMQVLPYYLHQLDLVQGAMHFEVGDAEARTIVDTLRSTLPGYAVPKLVREITGQQSKTPI